jgi:hypothetical protein
MVETASSGQTIEPGKETEEKTKRRSKQKDVEPGKETEYNQ